MAKKPKPPSIKQLPSGSYHTQIVIGKDANGKRIVESFTDASYAAVMQWALDRRLTREADPDPRTPAKMTFAQALDAYIESKSAVLSPSTIREYRRIRAGSFPTLMHIPLQKITQNDIQIAVNQEAMTLSPKTVRNHHALITSVLATYRPDFHVNTTLPQKVKPDISIPTDEQMQALFKAAKGSAHELPIILAACCGLRRSEICGLTWGDINFQKNTIDVRAALVMDENGDLVKKGTKTVAGKRTIPLLPPVRAALESIKPQTPDNSAPVVNLKPNSISTNFDRLLDKAGLPHFRFHDLRHYTVSVMLYLNIPKKYIADYVGHETENMIDQVYGHIMKDKKSTFTDLLGDYMTNLTNIENG